MARQPRTFLEHVRELRKRLLVCFLLFVAGGAATYTVRIRILDFIHRPLHQTLYYTSPAGAFNLAMKISLLGGVVLLLPAVTYNVLAFIRPALSKHITKHELRIATVLSLLLGIGGGMFAYYVVLPMSLNFFGKFAVGGLQSLISANDYVNFVINCLVAFVIIFQMPLLLLLIDRIRRLPPGRLLRYEHYVVIGSLVIALILPFTYDPITQFLIALPIISLFNFSLILLVLSHFFQDKRQRHTVRQTTSVIAPEQKPQPQPGPTQRATYRPQLSPPRIIADIAAPTDHKPHAIVQPPTRAASLEAQPVKSPAAMRPVIADIVAPSGRVPRQSTYMQRKPRYIRPVQPRQNFLQAPAQDTQGTV